MPTFSISPHAISVANEYLRKNYALQQPQKGCARPIHGVQHACRVAIYVVVFANLYRKYDFPLARELTAQELELIQIAALFHDSGRQNDGVDRWDNDSATNAYHYLIKLGKDHHTAKRIAEVIANKDTYSNSRTCHVLQRRHDGQVDWYKQALPSDYQRSMAQILLNDADRFDILRVIGLDGTMNIKRSYFYRYIAQHKPQAMDDLARVRNEIFSLISMHGDLASSDGRQRLDFARKLRYEHADKPFDTIISELLQSDDYPVLQSFYAENTLLDKFPRRELGSASAGFDVSNALEAHRVFTRSVKMPAAIATNKAGRSQAELELDKCLRPAGNPFRSISMIGDTCPPCGPVGFVLFDIPIARIQNIKTVDSHSGFASKKQLEIVALDEGEKVSQLGKLSHSVRCGGSYDPDSRTLMRHNEILFDLHASDFKAIYFHPDISLWMQPSSAQAPSRSEVILDALYLQGLYHHKTEKWLPILEYSSTHSKIRTITISDDEIVAHWLAVYRHWAEPKSRHSMLAQTFISNDLENNLAALFSGLYGVYRKEGIDDFMRFYHPDLKQKIMGELMIAKDQIAGQACAYMAWRYRTVAPFNLNTIEQSINDIAILFERRFLDKGRITQLLLPNIDMLFSAVETKLLAVFNALYQIFEIAKKINSDEVLASIKARMADLLSGEQGLAYPLMNRLASCDNKIFPIIAFLRELEQDEVADELERLSYAVIKSQLTPEVGVPENLYMLLDTLQSTHCDQDRIFNDDTTAKVLAWIAQMAEYILDEKYRHTLADFKVLLKLWDAIPNIAVRTQIKSVIKKLIMVFQYKVDTVECDERLLRILSQSGLAKNENFVAVMLRDLVPHQYVINYFPEPKTTIMNLLESLRQKLPRQEFTPMQLRFVKDLVDRWRKSHIDHDYEAELSLYVKLPYLGTPPADLLAELAANIDKCEVAGVIETVIERKKALLQRWTSPEVAPLHRVAL